MEITNGRPIEQREIRGLTLKTIGGFALILASYGAVYFGVKGEISDIKRDLRESAKQIDEIIITIQTGATERRTLQVENQTLKLQLARIEERLEFILKK